MWMCVWYGPRCKNVPVAIPSFSTAIYIHGLCGCLGSEKCGFFQIFFAAYWSESGTERKELYLTEVCRIGWGIRRDKLRHFPLSQLSAIISFNYKSHFLAVHDDISQLNPLTLEQQKALQCWHFDFESPMESRIFFFFFLLNSQPTASQPPLSFLDNLRVVGPRGAHGRLAAGTTGRMSAECLLYGITKAYRQHNRDTRLCNKVEPSTHTRANVQLDVIINIIIIIIVTPKKKVERDLAT